MLEPFTELNTREQRWAVWRKEGQKSKVFILSLKEEKGYILLFRKERKIRGFFSFHKEKDLCSQINISVSWPIRILPLEDF